MLYQVHLACTGFKLTTLVVIGTDFIGIKIQIAYDHDHDSPSFNWKSWNVYKVLSKNYHVLETVPKSNLKIVEIRKNRYPQHTYS